MEKNPNKKVSRYNVAILTRNASILAATPANALGGFSSEIYPFNSNYLPNTSFIILDTALCRQNLDEPRESERRTTKSNNPASGRLLRWIANRSSMTEKM